MVLKLRQEAPGRWRGAKCSSINVLQDDPFFSDDPADTEEAVAFCNGEVDGKQCPLRDKCLQFALSNNEEYGVWGGTSEITRKAIRRKKPVLKGNKPNPDWEWMSEQQALEGFSEKEIQDMRNTYIDDQDN